MKEVISIAAMIILFIMLLDAMGNFIDKDAELTEEELDDYVKKELYKRRNKHDD